MMEEKIKQASHTHAALLAKIISNSNKDVAERFNLNYMNSPKHPSFCTSDWVKEDFQRGVVYFIFELKDTPVGCVAFETPEPDIAYLNRLSVVPPARKAGIGKKMVLHHLNYSRIKAISKVSIGIIAQHTELRKWYKQIGFQEGETVQFKHLPFNVCYMSYLIKNHIIG